jgi:hypothetical protein
VRLYENNIKIEEKSLFADTPSAQKGEFILSNKSNGIYTYKVELCDTNFY